MSPRALVFLALDKVRLQDLDEAIRRYLALKSIVDEHEALNLDPHQVKQAETQLASAEGAVTARLSETYQWLLVKKFDNHCHALALYFVWYNFVKLQKTHKLTPAMAAGITDEILSRRGQRAKAQ